MSAATRRVILVSGHYLGSKRRAGLPPPRAGVLEPRLGRHVRHGRDQRPLAAARRLPLRISRARGGEPARSRARASHELCAHDADAPREPRLRHCQPAVGAVVRALRKRAARTARGAARRGRPRRLRGHCGAAAGRADSRARSRGAARLPRLRRPARARRPPADPRGGGGGDPALRPRQRADAEHRRCPRAVRAGRAAPAGDRQGGARPADRVAVRRGPRRGVRRRLAAVRLREPHRGGRARSARRVPRDRAVAAPAALERLVPPGAARTRSSSPTSSTRRSGCSSFRPATRAWARGTRSRSTPTAGCRSSRRPISGRSGRTCASSTRTTPRACGAR